MPTHVPHQTSPQSSVPPKAKPIPPFYRQPWFWILMLPLITSVILSSIMVKTAFQLGDDVVVGEYYKEGRMLNDRLQSNKAAQAAGLRADLRFDLEVGEILVTLSRQDGQALPNHLVLFLDHPVSEAQDRRLPLVKITDGYYRADLKKGLQHRWYLRLEPNLEAATTAEKTDDAAFWRLSGEISVNQTLSVRLLPNA